jgi:hypothetical protein
MEPPKTKKTHVASPAPEISRASKHGWQTAIAHVENADTIGQKV